MGWLIAAGALLLAIAILGMMAWQWCHTSDWQDRYWCGMAVRSKTGTASLDRPQSKPKLTRQGQGKRSKPRGTRKMLRGQGR